MSQVMHEGYDQIWMLDRKMMAVLSLRAHS